MKKIIMALSVSLAVVACDAENAISIKDAIAAKNEIKSRSGRNTNFPEVNKTYLLHDSVFGYQVYYTETDTQGWYWFPKHPAVDYTEHKVNDGEYCARQPGTKSNILAGYLGPQYTCGRLFTLRQTIIGEREGDVFNLKSGKVPYIKSKCDLPKGFDLTIPQPLCREN